MKTKANEKGPAVNRDRESVLMAVKKALGKGKSEPPEFEVPESEVLSVRLKDIEEGSRRRKEALIQTLSAEVEALSGKVFHVNSAKEATSCLESIIKEKEVSLGARWNHPLLDALKVDDLLKDLGIKTLPIHPMTNDPGATEAGRHFRKEIGEAEMGLSGVDFVLADSGTIFIKASAGRERATSLVPPIHVAFLRADQILPGLDELLPFLHKDLKEKGEPGSCLTLITGPSRTGDIELTLILGVHGPRELYFIILDD